jgi:hypothetical protein
MLTTGDFFAPQLDGGAVELSGRALELRPGQLELGASRMTTHFAESSPLSKRRCSPGRAAP